MPKSTQVGASLAAASVASSLREEILERNESGWLIGLEEDLMRTYGVSRPTLRQAIRVLESDGLLEVRRGVHGGLYGCVPSEDAVARTATNFLRSRGTSASELMVAQTAIFSSIAQLAVQHPERESLRKWMLESDAKGEYSARRALETSLEFMQQMAALADNQALLLFERVLYRLAQGPFDVGIYSRPDRREFALDHLRELAKAIADGNSDAALESIQRNSVVVLGWIEEAEKKK